jgi:hypothetical protein
LNNDLDPYAQAFNIASIITSIWGKGKEPFWQQSYTDLVRYLIVLHQVKSGFVTLVDIFRTVISSGQMENLLGETNCRIGENRTLVEVDSHRGQIRVLLSVMMIPLSLC